MRLDKYLCNNGSISRKEAKDAIRAGRVTVNGIVMKKGEDKVDENCDRVFLDGKEIRFSAVTVLAMHKLQGYVTAVSDPEQKTVMELLPKEYSGIGLVPVGRLDKDTEGLLLFTDDGDLLHHLISPKHEIKKKYYAEHEGTASEADVEAFRNGLKLKDGTICLPALLEPMGEGRSMITVQEGKYHQVRRMMASRELRVTYLRRETEGTVSLEGLMPGTCRLLSEEEIEELRK